jgi:replicative DNA helicase
MDTSYSGIQQRAQHSQTPKRVLAQGDGGVVRGKVAMSGRTIADELLEQVQKGELSYDQAAEKVNSLDLGSLETGRVYHRLHSDRRVQHYIENRDLRADMRRNRVPFISEDFCPGFWLSQGLTLVGALSGQSKSTTAANIIAGFLDSIDGKQIVVISNEEATDAILERVACIHLGLSYLARYNGELNHMDNEAIEDHARELTKRVEIVPMADWDMSCLEDVKAVLNYVPKMGDIGLVVVDYLQTITHSRDEPSLETFQVSKKFGLFLKDFGRRVRVPIVVFAQLKPKSDTSQIQDRFQNDRTIYNHAFNVIEIIPDFDTLMTTFTIHKGRFFNKQGHEVVMKFNKGKYTMEDAI